ncbi:ABC transporter permease [Desulfosporosinus sp.]|uniref:ABC transporter permease n=1 Tax=Desulfosporosinus sp. TaxID=157907 RepID=UPI0025C28EAD|nr:ABC transporter permease [Desulfosporosinus sp.]MBC2723089.1 ABC transporter permease [Desulfosporosinus sp.]MBC2726163.1 ABC transporter permease [Desulfosporosinus sp.]
MNLKGYKTVLIPLLFVLLLPSFSMLVLGYQFGDQVLEKVPFGVLDYDNSSLSRTLVQKIDENDTFDIKVYAETDAEIEESIRRGKIAAAIIIPNRFANDMMIGNNTPILMIYDNAQLSAAGTAKGKMSEIMSTLNMGSLFSALQSALKMSPVESAAMIQPLGFTTQLINPGKSSMMFSMHGSLLSMIQVTVFILALEITRRQDAFKPHIAIRNSVICGFLGTISAAVVTILQVTLFHFPFHGSKLAAFILIFLYLTGIAGLGIFVRLLKKDKQAAVEMIPILMMMMILSGYSYPLTSMPQVLQTIGGFIPFVHYGIPLRDIMLMGYGLKDVLPDIRWIIGFLILLWVGFLVLGVSRNRIGIFRGKGNKQQLLIRKKEAYDAETLVEER